MIPTTLRRLLIRLAAPALLVATSLALPAGQAFAAVMADGYLNHNGPCLMLKQHDGDQYALVGDTRGLRGGDHVRLEGRVVSDPGCGAPGLEVTQVRSLWRDDEHRVMLYNRDRDRDFERWAERSGRPILTVGVSPRGRGPIAEQADVTVPDPQRLISLLRQLIA